MGYTFYYCAHIGFQVSSLRLYFIFLVVHFFLIMAASLLKFIFIMQFMLISNFAIARLATLYLFDICVWYDGSCFSKSIFWKLIWWLARRHILVRFDKNDDCVLIRLTAYSTMHGIQHQFRVFPWTIGSNPKEERSNAFVWTSLSSYSLNHRYSP